MYEICHESCFMKNTENHHFALLFFTKLILFDIRIALFYKHSVIFKVKHKYFNLKVITDYFSKYKNNTINKKKILTDKKNFFYVKSYPKECRDTKLFHLDSTLRSGPECQVLRYRLDQI